MDKPRTDARIKISPLASLKQTQLFVSLVTLGLYRSREARVRAVGR